MKPQKWFVKAKKRKDQCIPTAMSLQDMYIERRLAHVESND